MLTPRCTSGEETPDPLDQGPLAGFTATIDETVDAIKSLPTVDGTAEILVPGDRGGRTGAERAASGIPLGPHVWRELAEVATALDVPVPATTG